jgi:hypothetical protein
MTKPETRMTNEARMSNDDEAWVPFNLVAGTGAGYTAAAL